MKLLLIQKSHASSLVSEFNELVEMKSGWPRKMIGYTYGTPIFCRAHINIYYVQGRI